MTGDIAMQNLKSLILLMLTRPEEKYMVYFFDKIAFDSNKQIPVLAPFHIT